MQLKLRLGLVQYAPEWESPRENMSILKRFLEKAGNGYDILIFPEMALTGFTMKSDVFAEIREGESARYFSSIARKYNTHVIAGMRETETVSLMHRFISEMMEVSPPVIERYTCFHWPVKISTMLSDASQACLVLERLKLDFQSATT